MAKIPEGIKRQVEEIIAKFNEENNSAYSPRYRGKFLYLDSAGERLCRLKYNGEIDNWDFAIFKWSSETYDPHEDFFPGANHVNGTVEGAMKAGLEAYPPKTPLLKPSGCFGCLGSLPTGCLIPVLFIGMYIMLGLMSIERFFRNLFKREKN